MEAPAPKRPYLALSMLLAAALAAAGLRLLPYSIGQDSALAPLLWNLAPILTILAFGVAQLRSPALGLLLPLAMMAGTDLILRASGNDPSTISQRLGFYGLFALLGLLGLAVRKKRTWPRVVAVCLAGPFAFFLISNFLVWLGADGSLYPKTLAGLAECYAAALPFLRNQLMGTAVFAGALFGGYAWIAQALPLPQPAEPILVRVKTSA